MDNFIVSARKYRPETFKSVIGQSSITNTLKNAILNGHVGHAYLFCGPRGVGKTTCARIFAKTLNCEQPDENAEPCNQCESCKSFNESRSYNIHELDAASNNTVDDIRSLNEKVRIPPQMGKYSVYIIDEVHMLSQSAFNAFLKTLEEPPSHAIFILATTEKHKIIPTILSRCQIFDFNRIKVDDTVSYLAQIASSEEISAENEALHIIAQKADGAMRDALSIFDQVVSFGGKEIKYQDVIDNLNILDYDYYFNLTEKFLSNDVSGSLLIFDEILDKGFDAQNFLNGLASHLRDLLVSLDKSTVQLLELSDSLKSKYMEQSAKCTLEFLYEALENCNQADIHYRASRNQRLLIELTLLKLANLTAVKKKPLNEVGETDDPEESKTSGKPPIKKETSAPSEKILPSDLPSEKSKGSEVKDDEKQKIAVKKNTVKASVISIKDAMNGNAETETKSEEKLKSEPETEKSVENKLFTQKDLIDVWNEFAENIAKERPRISSTLTSHEPVLKADSEVNVVLDNASQLEDFNQSIKNELRSYLRKKLQNTSIELEVEITEEEKTKVKLYTHEDQLKHLIEKNPMLDKLRKDLKLDFE